MGSSCPSTYKFTWSSFWLLSLIVTGQLREVSSRVAVAANVADVNFVAKLVSQQRGLPVDERVSDVATRRKVDPAAPVHGEPVVIHLVKVEDVSHDFQLDIVLIGCI